MAATVTIFTDLGEVGARIAAAGAAAPGIVQAALVPVAESVRTILDTEVKAATPKKTGALANSTDTTVTMAGMGATIEAHQPLTVSSSRGTYTLAHLLIDGYTTGEIVPINGKALMWEGLDHPVGRSKGHSKDPNDYGQTALEAAMPGVRDALDAAGLTIIREIVSIM